MSFDFTVAPTTPELLAEINFFSERLALLRGDNLYDVSRLYFAGKGVNCFQEALTINIKRGMTPQQSDEYVLETVEKAILAPAGLKFIRVIMGRLICTDTAIVGALVNVKHDNSKAKYDLLGNEKLVGYFHKVFLEVIENEVFPTLKRLSLTGNGSIVTSEESLPVRDEVSDISKMYPYLSEERLPAQFWERFRKSRSNVAVLIGPPGTGKSNWLTEFMFATGFKEDTVSMADREDVLMHPALSDHIRGLQDGSIFVTEDSDKLCMSREDGNSNMQALLNTSAGIASRNTKILISTNLESLSKVDKALLRHGRCFDIIEFGFLTHQQAADVREMMGLDPVVIPETEKKITLAMALNYHEHVEGRKVQTVGIGFRQ